MHMYKEENIHSALHEIWNVSYFQCSKRKEAKKKKDKIVTVQKSIKEAKLSVGNMPTYFSTWMSYTNLVPQAQWSRLRTVARSNDLTAFATLSEETLLLFCILFYFVIN